MVKGYIYRHWIVNDKGIEKSYIGLTKRELQERWRNGSPYLKTPTKFSKAILKYGWNSFHHEVIGVVESETEEQLMRDLNEWEKYYIWKYDSFYNGYNSTLGGDGTLGLSGEKNGMYGKHHSDETKTKIASKKLGKDTYMKGKKHKPESIELMREKHKRENLSDETIQKMSKSQKGRTDSEETRKRKSEARKGCKNPQATEVICLNTGDIFPTIKDAKKWLKQETGTDGDISKCCRGITKTAGKNKMTGEKYEWMYLEDFYEIFDI